MVTRKRQNSRMSEIPVFLSIFNESACKISRHTVLSWYTHFENSSSTPTSTSESNTIFVLLLLVADTAPQIVPVLVQVARTCIVYSFFLRFVRQESVAQIFEGLSNPLSIRNRCIRHGPSGIGCFGLWTSLPRERQDRGGDHGTLAISVRAKSAPTWSRGQPLVPATSQAKQSPKFSPAGWTPLPHRAQTPATRRATASGTAAISSRNPSTSPAISAPTPRHSATIDASTTGAAESMIRPLVARASAQAAASGSSGKTAVNPEAPTAILAAGHRRHGENPGCGRRRPPPPVCSRWRPSSGR